MSPKGKPRLESVAFGVKLATPEAVSLWLPVPPTANHYWRVWHNRAVRSREATDYLQAVNQLTSSLQRWGWPTQDVVSLSIRWVRERRAGDLDNRLKVALDALKGTVYVDDKQVHRIVAVLTDAEHRRPRIEVEVRRITGEVAA